jgi:hypothetical protein
VLAGPAEQVRLENRHQPPAWKRLARPVQRCRDLGFVVRVVVHDRYAPDFSDELEATTHAAKVAKRAKHRIDRGAELDSYRQSGSRIPQVV